MTDQGKKYLSDIILAIDLIGSFTVNVSDFEKLFPEKQLDNSRKIVGLRNRIIHSYDTIDSSMIWTIIKKHLTPLKRQVQDLIK